MNLSDFLVKILDFSVNFLFFWKKSRFLWKNYGFSKKWICQTFLDLIFEEQQLDFLVKFFDLSVKCVRFLGDFFGFLGESFWIYKFFDLSVKCVRFLGDFFGFLRESFWISR